MSQHNKIKDNVLIVLATVVNCWTYLKLLKIRFLILLPCVESEIVGLMTRFASSWRAPNQSFKREARFLSSLSVQTAKRTTTIKSKWICQTYSNRTRLFIPWRINFDLHSCEFQGNKKWWVKELQPYPQNIKQQDKDLLLEEHWLSGSCNLWCKF